ncbi:MAG: TlpA disulfide reductase family protein [Bryobacteraceae bacterium]|jgi:thiol-disulfide isomerase/thioredoxin
MRSAALIIGLAVGSVALAMPPVPRKAPEFTIVEPSGKETLLTSMKGKVVLIGFVATWCEHCQQFSQMLTKIQRDLGPRGFQAMDVAFNQGVTPAMVNEFVHRFGITFPVGYASPDTVMNYLGISLAERYVYPEVVIVDRKGIIRAQSPSSGDPNLQDEKYLRNLLEGLLKEGTGSAAKK